MDIHNENAHLGQQNINSNIYYQYGERKIKKFLTAPFFPDTFLGREAELQLINDKLFTDSNMLLLVNGMGGMGKTSLAAEYYRRHHTDYQHLGWLYVQTNIADALLTLKEPLQITFGENTSPQEQLQILLNELRELRQPCLLVIDNANTSEDLQAQYAALRSCLNLHILITTRIKAFAKAAICQVGALPYEQALQLFSNYYIAHDAADEVLFEQVYNAVEGNTLIIELLAKNLDVLQATHSGYCLAELVADLKQGVLKITQTKPVESAYHDNKMFTDNPLDIIAAMYDLGELAPAEKRLLSILAVLPAESISFTTLQALLPTTEDLGEVLHSLGRKGWIAHDQQAAAYKISPVIQEITRAKNTDLLEDCGELIAVLKKKLQNNTQHITGCSYAEAPLYMRYAESVLGQWEMDKPVFDLLLEKLGSCHAILGNLPKALHFYQLDAQLCQTLCNTSPEDADLKQALTIAYSRLGETYSAMGNLQEALRFYTDYKLLMQQLYDAYPDNVDFKNGLAISNCYLGNIHAKMGNLQEALRFYTDCKLLMQQLYDAYPDNVDFKNNLAISYQFLGYTQASLGNLQEALRFYKDY